MVKPSPLDNRDTSKIAWTRYRRLMKGMALVSFGAVVLALGWLRFTMPAPIRYSPQVCAMRPRSVLWRALSLDPSTFWQRPACRRSPNLRN